MEKKTNERPAQFLGEALFVSAEFFVPVQPT